MSLVKFYVLGVYEPNGESYTMNLQENFPHEPGPYQDVATVSPRPIWYNGEQAYLACAGGSDPHIFSRTVITEGVRAWGDLLGAAYPNSLNAGMVVALADHTVLGPINNLLDGNSDPVYCIFGAQVYNTEDATPPAIEGMGFDEPMPGSRKIAMRDYLELRWSLGNIATTWFQNNPEATPRQAMERFKAYLK